VSDGSLERRGRAESITGNFYYLKYPLEPKAGSAETHVTIATTRPETMLGDTAVAVHPQDASKASLVGRTALLPFVNRKIPIIADEHVKYGADQVGSGALKVTPGHDPQRLRDRAATPLAHDQHPRRRWSDQRERRRIQGAQS